MKKTSIRVLVTGVGGNIGQGIIKAVRMSKLKATVIGTDANPISSGLLRCDRAYVVSRSADPRFFSEIVRILRREKIDILLVGSDEEIKFFAKNKKRIESSTGSFVLASNESISRIGYDKWYTYLFCRSRQIPFPATFLKSHAEDVNAFIRKNGFPIIVKPRVGYGSKNVFKVHNKQELKVFLDRVPNAVVQEFIGSDHEEYTASSFVLENRKIFSTIIFRRILSAGATYKAEVVQDRKMRKKIEAIVNKLAPLGPCNVQFRMHRNRLIPFEFNVRFSGTTPIRSYLGFNDVEMALRHFVLQVKLKQPKIKKAVAFRYWNEIIAMGQSFKSLSKKKQYDQKSSKAQVVNFL